MKQDVKNRTITKDKKKGILSKGKQVSSVFFVFAAITLIVTIIVPMGPYANPFVIYSRNISSLAVLTLLGFYFRKWGGQDKYLTSKKMKKFKFFTLIAALACLAKAALTCYYFYIMNMDITVAGSYYLGEAILWTALAVFFFSYFIVLLPCHIVKGDPKSVEEIGRFL